MRGGKDRRGVRKKDRRGCDRRVGMSILGRIDRAYGLKRISVRIVCGSGLKTWHDGAVRIDCVKGLSSVCEL